MSLPIRALGTSGLEVSRCTLGTSALCSWGGHDIASGAEVVRAAFELGITAVDTAPAYADGEAEKVAGHALRGCRDEVVVMTKFPGPHVGKRPPPVDEMPRMLEASLRRLGTDHVDLYQLHDRQSGWPVDDVLAVLHDLVDAGTIRARLSGRYRPLVRPPSDSRARTWPVRQDRYDRARPAVGAKLEVVDALTGLADDAGLDLPTFALAWVLAHPGVDSVVVGPRTVEHLAAVPAALEAHMPDELLARVDELVPPGTTVDPRDLPTYLAGARRSRAASHP